jgi:hypothetical protein
MNLILNINKYGKVEYGFDRCKSIIVNNGKIYYEKIVAIKGLKKNTVIKKFLRSPNIRTIIKSDHLFTCWFIIDNSN